MNLLIFSELDLLNLAFGALCIMFAQPGMLSPLP